MTNQSKEKGSFSGGDLHAAIMNLPCEPGGFVGAERSYIGAYEKGHRDARHAAAELVAADESTRAPDGWKLVPLEPTREMLDAVTFKTNVFRSDAPKVWKVMLDAAPPSGERPSAPAPEGEKHA